MGFDDGARKSWVTRLLAALVTLMLIGWGLGALCTSLLTPADLDAVRDLAADRTRAVTVMAHVFSWLGSGYTVYPVTLGFCLILYRRARRTRALAVGISTAGVVAIYDIDKLLVGRHRPAVHHLDLVHGWSFPSGHTAQATALTVAMLIALLNAHPRRAIAIGAVSAGCLLVAGVGFSRVYLGVHYPSDVAAGALLGASWSALASWLTCKSPSSDDVTSPRWRRSFGDTPVPP
jgi:membrane-associated phospholipid phosphatase